MNEHWIYVSEWTLIPLFASAEIICYLDAIFNLHKLIINSMSIFVNNYLLNLGICVYHIQVRRYCQSRVKRKQPIWVNQNLPPAQIGMGLKKKQVLSFCGPEERSYYKLLLVSMLWYHIDYNIVRCQQTIALFSYIWHFCEVSLQITSARSTVFAVCRQTDTQTKYRGTFSDTALLVRNGNLFCFCQWSTSINGFSSLR